MEFNFDLLALFQPLKFHCSFPKGYSSQDCLLTVVETYWSSQGFLLSRTWPCNCKTPSIWFISGIFEAVKRPFNRTQRVELNRIDLLFCMSKESAVTLILWFCLTLLMWYVPLPKEYCLVNYAGNNTPYCLVKSPNKVITKLKESYRTISNGLKTMAWKQILTSYHMRVSENWCFVASIV